MMGFGLNLDSIKELDVPAAQTEEEMNLYITVVAASFIVTFLMFFVLEYIVKIYNPSFLKNLSSSNRTLLLTQIQSNIHAIIVCYLSTYVLYQSEELKADYIWGKCQLASVACAVTIGYMAADLLTLIIRWKDVGEWSYVFHHLFSALAFIYIIDWQLYLRSLHSVTK
ncbi:TMEM56 [Bugula neritina]|uniref:TMEM56 n=1 Tax=Bugula neritina TaxID=10212 RepID=A0A7J7J4W3_BUGNE|nr:TMEM56 [Bugula neritina]